MLGEILYYRTGGQEKATPSVKNWPKQKFWPKNKNKTHNQGVLYYNSVVWDIIQQIVNRITQLE